MSFFLLLVYVALTYIHPAELYPQLQPYRITLVTGVVGLLAAAARVLLRQIRIPPVPIVLFLLFTGSLAFSRVANGWLGGAPDALDHFAPAAIMFFMAVLCVDSQRKMTIFGVVLVCVALVLALQGILAYHFKWNEELFVLHELLDARTPGGPRPVLDRIRGVGVLNDPNDLGQALLAVLPFVALAWRRSSKLRNLIVVYAPAAVLLYGIYLTHSRGAVIGGLAIAAVAMYGRVSKKVAAVTLVLLFALTLALNVSGGRGFSGDAEGSAEGRIDAWSEGLGMFKGSPLFGVGYLAFTDEYNKTAHNSFVLCFAELGITGYFCWLALLVTTFVELRKSTRASAEEPQRARWARIFQLSLASFLASGFFLSRTYAITLYMLLGGALATSRLGEPADADPDRAMFWVPKVAAVELASILFIYILVRIGQ